MASKSTGKKKPSASSGAPRSYSEVYKNSAASVAPAAPAPAKANGAAPKSTGSAAKSNGAAARKPEAASVAVATSDDVDWKGEYGYVLDDLRFLGIVTASLVAAIILVGIFL